MINGFVSYFFLVNLDDRAVSLNSAKHDEVIAIDRIKCLAVGLVHNYLWMGKLFCLVVVFNVDKSSFCIKQVYFAFSEIVRIYIYNIGYVKVKVILVVSFYKINRSGIMIEPILTQTFIEFSDQDLVSLKTLQMRKCDINRQGIRLVTFLV